MKHIYLLELEIWKKGDQQVCYNYREITLLSIYYKILSQRRFKTILTTQNKTGQYQCGFLLGRSTVDAIIAVRRLKQVKEKVYKYGIKIDILFLDFQRAFTSTKRQKLKMVLKSIDVPGKLRKLITMTSIKNLNKDSEK